MESSTRSKRNAPVKVEEACSSTPGNANSELSPVDGNKATTPTTSEPDPVGDDKATTAQGTAVAVKSEPDPVDLDSTLSKTEDGVVEDVTKEVKEQRENNRKRKQSEAVVLSSDEEEETGDSAFDEDSDEEDDESDAWDDDVGEGDGEPMDDGEVEMEEECGTKSTKEPPLLVLMEEKDVPAAPGKPNKQEENDTELEQVSTLVGGHERTKAARAVKDRIIKLLNTGFHDQSNEHEAKNAMKLAQRMMKKYNLSQAVLLKEREQKNDKEQSNEILKGGIVQVQIFNRRTGKVAVMASWISRLIHPICKNFDVKSFHSVRRGYKCEVSFYGIYTNCQLAGYAFKVATERISQMCDEYKPKPHRPVVSWGKQIGTKTSRLSYGIGIVEGIKRDIDRNIRIEKEERERKMEQARMAATRGEAYIDSDDDDGGEDDGCISFPVDDKEKVARSFDPEEYASSGFEGSNIDTLFEYAHDASSLSSLERVKRDLASKILHLKKDDGPNWIKKQKAYWKERLSKEDFKEAWKTAKDYAFRVWEVSRKDFPKSKSELEAVRRQKLLKAIEKEKEAAIVLVNHREKVADQVLEDHGIKLSSSRRRSKFNLDPASHRRGMEDSKNVDINQRSLRNGVSVKKEVKRRKRR